MITCKTHAKKYSFRFEYIFVHTKVYKLHKDTQIVDTGEGFSKKNTTRED